MVGAQIKVSEFNERRSRRKRSVVKSLGSMSFAISARRSASVLDDHPCCAVSMKDIEGSSGNQDATGKSIPR